MRSATVFTAFTLLFLGCAISASAQEPSLAHKGRVVIPDSAIERPEDVGVRAHTPYQIFVLADREKFGAQPNGYALPEAVAAPNTPPFPGYGFETPASIACLYHLVTPVTGCNPNSFKTNPTGGSKAIGIVDAFDYPTAMADLNAFSKQFGLPAVTSTTFKVIFAGGTGGCAGTDPGNDPGWEGEQALDIEWAHAMAPNAKLFLVESKQVNTDPTWAAVKLAANLVANAGGGVVSMSWGDPEVAQEINWDAYFTKPGVVYFAASGDSGIGVSIYPGASPNVVSVGGTHFNRDPSGNFVNEVYYTGGGGGDLSPYEPRPSYQDGVSAVVGTHRGYPDVAADYCCAAVYLQGRGWISVGGTSWASPTFAGIVNAAGNKQTSSRDELSWLYSELANPSEYQADFKDITQGDSRCKVGFDQCTGIGAPRTYVGK